MENEGETKEKDCPLDIGDWLEFLESRASANIGIGVSAASLFIYVFFAYWLISVHPVGIGGTLFVLFIMPIMLTVIYIIIVEYLSYSRGEAKVARELIDMIIDGSFNNPNEIRTKWREKNKKVI